VSYSVLTYTSHGGQLTSRIQNCTCSYCMKCGGCMQEAAKISPVQQGRQYRAHANSSSSDSSQSPPRQRAREY